MDAVRDLVSYVTDPFEKFAVDGDPPEGLLAQYHQLGDELGG